MAEASLEERVAYLEGKVEEHSRGYAQLREDIQQLRQQVIHVDQKIDRFREELAARIDALDQRLSGRIDALDQKLSGRIDALDQRLSGRIDALDQKLSGRIDALDQKFSGRIDALDQKFSRWFAWLAGILITALLAQLGLLGAALFRR